MNEERISELVEQAMWHTNSKTGEVYRTHFQFNERFAELIIREHLSVWEAMDNGNAVEGYLDMADYPLAIRKRFGIDTK